MVSDRDFEAAWAKGETAGADPTLEAECPHDPGETELRLAWFEGFDAGKAQREAAGKH